MDHNEPIRGIAIPKSHHSSAYLHNVYKDGLVTRKSSFSNVIYTANNPFWMYQVILYVLNLSAFFLKTQRCYRFKKQY